MGRHDGSAAAPAPPAAPWFTRAARAVVRWLGRLALGALAGAVVLGATTWAGTSWESARAFGAGAAVLVVIATALAATLPATPDRPPAPVADDPRTRRAEPRDDL